MRVKSLNKSLQLSLLLKGLEGKIMLIHGSEKCEISSIEYNSKNVIPESLFVAVEGFSVDGHEHITEAVAKGAKAVVLSSRRVSEFCNLKEKGVVILASDNKAGIELLKLKHSQKKCMTVLPEENIAGNVFLKEQGFELHNQAYRMALGGEVDWKPQSVFCRIGGYYA